MESRNLAVTKVPTVTKQTASAREFSDRCPIDNLLRILMGPWTTYILWVLATEGPKRFGAIKRELAGISSKVLTVRLRSLEEAGIIYRDYEPTVPPAVTYGLTPKGEELRDVLAGLDGIARRWFRTESQADAPSVSPNELPASLDGGRNRPATFGAALPPAD